MARRVCDACKKMTPLAEPGCVHCGGKAASEMAWKVPVIVAMFVGAVILSVVLGAIR